MHLYYTSTSEDGNPLITFEWNRENVNHTVDEISETVRCIEEKSLIDLFKIRMHVNSAI